MTAEFGQAVRRWRERLTPAAVGLPAGGRRRAAGLRREELGLPVSVLDATWTLLTANPLWTALMGDLSEARGLERNIVWRHFMCGGGRVWHTPSQAALFEAAMISDLRAAAARYPADRRLHDLIAGLRSASGRFAELWNSGVVGGHIGGRKTIVHPSMGEITVDCDVLTVVGGDLRVVAYTAEPGSADADRLELLAVVGIQAMA